MKKFLIGFLLGAILFGGLTAYATTIKKPIEVSYTVNDIIINNVSKMPKDDLPFIYEGRTYVPLRFISEALGAQVDWNDENRTIIINTAVNDQDEIKRLQQAAYFQGTVTGQREMYYNIWAGWFHKGIELNKPYIVRFEHAFLFEDFPFWMVPEPEWPELHKRGALTVKSFIDIEPGMEYIIDSYGNVFGGPKS